MFRHVYLSPHFDDASLSCGGNIHRQEQAGEPVLVVTVCAAPPSANEPLSPFAESQHKNWGNPGDIVAMRQTEDQAHAPVVLMHTSVTTSSASMSARTVAATIRPRRVRRASHA